MSEPEQQTLGGLVPAGSRALATRSSGLVQRGLELIRDAQLKKQKVLVTDDEPWFLDSMKYILESWGYEVVILKSKIEALERLRLGEIKPDLVTTDIASPDLSGFDFVRWVKELSPSVPVIVISGNLNPSYDINGEKGREALRLGAFACLPKPFDVTELRQVMDRALKLRD